MSRRSLFAGRSSGRIALVAGSLALTLAGLPWGTTTALAESSAALEPGWDENYPVMSVVTNGWVDVREILRNVAANAGLGLQMAPDVAGDVNVHLEGVRLGAALDALLTPAGLGYEVTTDALIVHKRGLVTRWFDFDYPVTEREGRGELEVSVSRDQSSGGSSGGSGGGESGGENQNKSHVTSTATMSIWPEVMKSLRVVVFEASSEEAAAAQETTARGLSQADAAGRSLVVNPMAGLVQVTAEWDRVQKVETLLGRLQESLQRQVAIEVRILEISLDSGSETGINWDTILDGEVQGGLHSLNPLSGVGENYLQFTVDSKRLTGVMEIIETAGDLHVVSTPRVTTLNNQKAIVRVVREDVFYLASVSPAVVSNGVATEPVVSYSPQTVSVGVVLDVTPQVGRDRVITLNVHPTISDVVGLAESPNLDTAPILSIRELDTVGKVTSGETLIIAGLISERDRYTRAGVPVLKDIPLLGYLFGKTSRERYSVELVMLLTPVLMEGAGADEMADSIRAAMEKKM